MKVSEITVSNIAEYLRLSDGEYTPEELTPVLTTAKQFISNYTGIPITPIIDPVTLQSSKCLDDYEDFYIVVMILCQDMYDNRTFYVDNRNLNKVVDAILGMHCTNLL
ncbi:MAG: head-tail connector protein [Porphyromonadaceae bacterium]|nr:head-tail connector protein [Porphyromonadaceae bacterium]